MLGRRMSTVRDLPHSVGCRIRCKCAAGCGVMAALSIQQAPRTGRRGVSRDAPRCGTVVQRFAGPRRGWEPVFLMVRTKLWRGYCACPAAVGAPGNSLRSPDRPASKHRGWARRVKGVCCVPRHGVRAQAPVPSC